MTAIIISAALTVISCFRKLKFSWDIPSWWLLFSLAVRQHQPTQRGWEVQHRAAQEAVAGAKGTEAIGELAAVCLTNICYLCQCLDTLYAK